MACKRAQRIEKLNHAEVGLVESNHEAFSRGHCDDETRAEVEKLIARDRTKGGSGLLTCMTSYFVCSVLSAIPFASDLHAWCAKVGIAGIEVLLLIEFYGLFSNSLFPASDPFLTSAKLRPS